MRHFFAVFLIIFCVAGISQGQEPGIQPSSFWPPLTTVSQPLYDVGCTSVAELTRMIEVGRQGNTAVEPKTTMLQPELIVRESSVKDKSTGGS